MKRLLIRNVGPIKNVNIELKRFNFFIGPQSSGKSTVAKIFSTCQWIEKEVLTSLNEQAIPNGEEFVNLIEKFHNMEGYFQEDSQIEYETSDILLQYQKRKFCAVPTDNERYSRKKICYIPSERNLVTLSGLQSFEFGRTSIKSFLFDWFGAREAYQNNKQLPILNLGLTFYCDLDGEQKKNYIKGAQMSKAISLSSASSGLQSMIPLLVVVNYYSEDTYFRDSSQRSSFKNSENVRKITSFLYAKYFENGINDNLDSISANKTGKIDEFLSHLSRLVIPEKTSFVIEEPEQNLYPSTQRDVIDKLFSLFQSGGREHECTITTHSPYIINYLNVLLLRYYTKKDDVSIDPEELSVFLLEDGALINLLQTNERTRVMSVQGEDLVESMRDIQLEYQDLKTKLIK